ncbi:KAT8 regulatory NSL complex subunit 2-like isoform X2 [Convolutriloba macropyga]|uniref:KAT8 regulatory NSL complex subunit 2-like isoform X2 n=1 Tax=Convolutriloba macropyga TaxID=536237 RepID=UPI003F5211C8
MNQPASMNSQYGAVQPKREGSLTSSQASYKLTIPKEKMCSFKKRICRRPCVKSSDFCEVHVPVCAIDSQNGENQKEQGRCSFVAPRTSKQCWNPAVFSTHRSSNGRLEKKVGRQFCRQHRTQKRSSHVQRLKSKAIVDKYTRNLKRLSSKSAPHTVQQVIDSPDSKDERPFTGRMSPLFTCEQLDDSLVDIEDSDEEMIDRLPVSGFQPDCVENDFETRDTTSNDPLKHACIYTSEEIGRILCLKMKRLQQLYKQQFKFLEYELNLANVECIKQLATLPKKSQINSQSQNGIQSQSNEQSSQTLEADEHERSIKFLKNMRRHRGQEALLKLKHDQKRRIFSTTEETNTYNSNINQVQSKCSFILASKSSLRCGKRTVPKSKYCLDHIVSDRNQVLFSQCAIVGDDSKNCTTILKPYLFENSCDLHRKLQPVVCSILPSQDYNE